MVQGIYGYEVGGVTAYIAQAKLVATLLASNTRITDVRFSFSSGNINSLSYLLYTGVNL